VRNKPGERDHEVLERNWSLLKSATDEQGKPLEVIELPMPETIRYTYPPGQDYDVAREGLPASYANFLVSNGAVFVPTFDQPTDDAAMHILAEVMPEHEIVGIPARHLLVGLGGLHCLTMQQPALPVDRLPTTPPVA
jgi:agmatine deiminase